MRKYAVAGRPCCHLFPAPVPCERVRFKGRSALVTGAVGGIGRVVADALEKEGARVHRADARTGLDVTDERALADLVRGLGALDLAVNAAGIEGEMAKTMDGDAAEFARVIEVNLRGVFLAMKAELAAGCRSIVNVSSVAGLVGWHGAAAYSASKHGVVGLTRTAALEYARQGVRVNAVCPGVTHTPMYERMVAANPLLAERTVAANPMRRVARPEEVSAPILFLLSDEASFITGVALPIDGGLTAQ